MELNPTEIRIEVVETVFIPQNLFPFSYFFQTLETPFHTRVVVEGLFVCVIYMDSFIAAKRCCRSHVQV
jgi:hypothetical protein